jgi:hypothetical protein
MVLVAACLAALAACGGCGGRTPAPRVTYVATDGQRVSTGDYHDEMTAVKASGAHDLSCPAAQIETRRISLSGGHQDAAEGCSKRALYACPLSDEPNTFSCILTSIVPLGGP